VGDYDYIADGLLPPRHLAGVPYGPQDLATIIDEELATNRDAAAIAGGGLRYTYAELEAAICAATAALVELGVSAGVRVAASLRNHPDTVVTFLASQRLNAIWVGINRAYAASEKIYMLRDAGAALLLATPEVAAEVDAMRADVPDLLRIVVMRSADPTCEWTELLSKNAGAKRLNRAVDPWRPAVISYTSGTTGLPKGVVHSQHNVALAIAARLQVGALPSRVGVATALTITNVMVTGALVYLAAGHFVFCIERPFVQEIVRQIEHERLEMVAWVPTMVYDFLDEVTSQERNLPTLRLTSLGAMHVPQEARRRIEAYFGDGTIYTYGLTEAPTWVAISYPGHVNPTGASGKAMPHLTIEIRDPQGTPQEAGATGEIWIGPVASGPYADAYQPMLGYWRNPAATSENVAEGWVRTGDLGSLDEAGYLTIKGRMKDMIIRGGANIYSAEIERVLERHEDVLACAVIPKPDHRLGEIVAAVVQLRCGVSQNAATSQRLADFCSLSLAPYKVPSHWAYVAAMPTNEMGKVVKAELKKLLE
jgi:long-chain acyl-CoA synthetase